MDRLGPRETGVIPVTQLSYIFGRNVPFASGPFQPLRTLDDRLLDAPGFQQADVQLILDTLRTSDRPVEILSFGSARAIAAAHNREPELLRAKVGRIHLCATPEGGFAYDRHNTYWKFDNLGFVREMDPRLRSYLWYAFERVRRVDFLQAVDEPVPEDALFSIIDRGDPYENERALREALAALYVSIRP